MSYPQPSPIPAPPSEKINDSPSLMENCSKSHNYSSPRLDSYHRHGGSRDNFWISTDSWEVTLAEIKGRARNYWWYMPFNSWPRVTVSTTSSGENRQRETVPIYFYIDYRVYPKPIKNIHYLYSRFIETDPAPQNKPGLFAEAKGDGQFMGIVIGHRTRTPGWFGEGDDIITVDATASFLGTGTEDYFCDAWGFRQFSDLYHGVPILEGREEGNRFSAYRFHIIDPIPFRKSFKLRKKFIFEDFYLFEGIKIFCFYINGKNENSQRFKIGIDCLVLKKKTSEIKKLLLLKKELNNE